MNYPPGFVSYILFDPNSRELLGGYLQVPPPEHASRIEVSDEVRVTWPLYMLNEDMTGILLDPRYQPGYEPPVNPEPDPEYPPVDPDPEPPVQSGN